METNTVDEEQMEDLAAFQDQLNQEYKQRQRDDLKTPAGMKKFIKSRVNKFTAKLIKEEKYQIPMVVSLIYILLSGIWYVLASLFSLKTVFVILLCIALVNRKKIAASFLKIKIYIKYVLFKIDEFYSNVKNYVGHILFRVKSVFIKRK